MGKVKFPPNLRKTVLALPENLRPLTGPPPPPPPLRSACR